MKKNNFLFPAALAALILSDPALAAAGTQSLNNTLQTILSVFQGASLLIVTGAIIWAGYRMLYTHANIQTVGGPFLVVQSINTLSIKQMRTQCLQASISSGRSPVPHSLA